jgi:hypothetical protein
MYWAISTIPERSIAPRHHLASCLAAARLGHDTGQQTRDGLSHPLLVLGILRDDL